MSEAPTPGASTGPPAGRAEWPELHPPPICSVPSGKTREGRECSWSRHETTAPGSPRWVPTISRTLSASGGVKIQRGQGAPGGHCHAEMTVPAKEPRDTVWKAFAHRPWAFPDAVAALTSHLHPAESSAFVALEKQHCPCQGTRENGRPISLLSRAHGEQLGARAACASEARSPTPTASPCRCPAGSEDVSETGHSYAM